MKYDFQNCCVKKLPKVVTIMAVASSVSLVGDITESHANDLENIVHETKDKNLDITNTASTKSNELIIDDSNINTRQNTGWIKENGSWYYLKDGLKCIGWIKDNGSWYWLKSDGKMAENEWIKEDGSWYWLTSNGRMAENEWIKEDGSWYWLGSNGKMYENKWLSHRGSWYWLGSNGKMYENKWLSHRGSWYWLQSDGKMICNSISKINGVWYRFDSNGKMDSNTNFNVGQVKPCDFLNVRSSASASSTVLTKVVEDEYVELLGLSNNWYKVKTGNGTIGWASANYISVVNGTIQNDSLGSNIGSSEDSTNSKKIQSITNLAKQQLGKPYEWGAEGPNSFDCSGLTYYVYKQHGITIPRTSIMQANAGRAVSRSNLQPGDLVFFNTNGSGISHVGIYIGDGKMIHSTRPGDVVKTTDINSSYYSSKYVTARKIIE